MIDKQKYIKGLFLCYNYSKKKAGTKKLIDQEIIELTNDILSQLSKYDSAIIREYYFENRTLSNIAISLNYSSHTSIHTKVNQIIAKIEINKLERG